MTMSHAAGHAPANIVAKLEGLRDWLSRAPTALFQILFRVGVASVFFKSGLTKIANWDTTVALFRDEYRVPVLPPEIAAYLGTAAELGCSTLIFFGLASRLATLPLIGLTLVIEIFVYPENWSEHLIWISMLLFILTRGPGAFSLDALIRRFLVHGRM